VVASEIVCEVFAIYYNNLKLRRKVVNFLWRWRWVIILTSSVLVFIFVDNSLLNLTNDPGFNERGIRYKFAIIFVALVTQLIASLICILHSLVSGRIKWLLGLFLFPPIAFIYLFSKSSDLDECKNN
jgi:hypothetical protein